MKKSLIIILLSFSIPAYSVEEYDWKNIERPKDPVEAQNRIVEANKEVEIAQGEAEDPNDPTKKERDIALAQMKLARANYFSNEFVYNSNLPENVRNDALNAMQTAAGIADTQFKKFQELAGLEQVPAAEAILRKSIFDAPPTKVIDIISTTYNNTLKKNIDAGLIKSGWNYDAMQQLDAMLKYADEFIQQDSTLSADAYENYMGKLIGPSGASNLSIIEAQDILTRLSPKYSGLFAQTPDGKLIIDYANASFIDPDTLKSINFDDINSRISQEITVHNDLYSFSIQDIVSNTDWPKSIRDTFELQPGKFLNPDLILPGFQDVLNQFNSFKGKTDEAAQFDRLLKDNTITNATKARAFIDKLQKIAYIQRTKPNDPVAKNLLDAINDMIAAVRRQYPSIISPIEEQLMRITNQKSSVIVNQQAKFFIDLLTSLQHEVDMLSNALQKQLAFPGNVQGVLIQRDSAREEAAKANAELDKDPTNVDKKGISLERNLAVQRLDVEVARNLRDLLTGDDAARANTVFNDAQKIYAGLLEQYKKSLSGVTFQGKKIIEQLRDNVVSWFQRQGTAITKKFGDLTIVKSIRTKLNDLYTTFINKAFGPNETIRDVIKSDPKTAKVAFTFRLEIKNDLDKLDGYIKQLSDPNIKPVDILVIANNAQSILADLIYFRNQLLEKGVDENLLNAGLNISELITKVDSALSDAGLSSNDRRQLEGVKSPIRIPTDPTEIKGIIFDAAQTDFGVITDALNSPNFETDPVYINLQNKLLEWESIDSSKLSDIDKVRLYSVLRDAYDSLFKMQDKILRNPQITAADIEHLLSTFADFFDSYALYENLYNSVRQDYVSKNINSVQLPQSELGNKLPLTTSEMTGLQRTINGLIDTWISAVNESKNIENSYQNLKTALDTFNTRIKNSLVSQDTILAQVWLVQVRNRLLNAINDKLNFGGPGLDTKLLSKIYLEVAESTAFILKQIATDRMALLRTKKDQQGNVTLVAASNADRDNAPPLPVPQITVPDQQTFATVTQRNAVNDQSVGIVPPNQLSDQQRDKNLVDAFGEIPLKRKNKFGGG